jgi:hypothetical protein
MRRPVFAVFAVALVVVSAALAFVPTGGGTTYFSGRGYVGGGDCGSSYVENLSYRRPNAGESETYGCLPETAPRMAWSLLAAWGAAAAIAVSLLRKERLPRRVVVAAPIVILAVFILATGRALWLSQQ